MKVLIATKPIDLRKVILASLIGTAKLNAIDLRAYLADILARIANDHPIIRIVELLPWTWASTANRNDAC